MIACMHTRNLQPGAVEGSMHACTKILSHRITERGRPINVRFSLRVCTCMHVISLYRTGLTRSGVRKGEGGDFIDQVLKSCCVVGFQRLNRFPCCFWIIVGNDGMEGVMDGLSQEAYELSDEVVLICCWCGGEKRRSLMVLEHRLNI
jgi:hypothetical protein